MGSGNDVRNPLNHCLYIRAPRATCDTSHSLEDISVEGLLAVAEELSDHLSAQALPLQQEVGHSDGRVRDEASRDQELEALVWVSVFKKRERK